MVAACRRRYRPPTACARWMSAPTTDRPPMPSSPMRVKDLTYSADLPLSGELKGELDSDGVPTYFRGKIHRREGHIIDGDSPDS